MPVFHIGYENTNPSCSLAESIVYPPKNPIYDEVSYINEGKSEY